MTRLLSSFALAVVFSLSLSAADPAHWNNAPTPPMGWNSWDCFGTTLTEAQAKEQAAAMAKELLPSGYNVFTVDIQWYEPHARGHDYKEGAPLAMDANGRLVPAPEKFPSAANGAGFKPLADYVHGLGLKFGIHLMRGIPRQAVKANTPVLGTSVGARDIALTSSTCAWNPDMFGVDATKPEGQAYYQSLFDLYASWGVDYVKVDDIARPYNAVQQAEIEAIRHAIDHSGRPMVLSLSPGDTPLEKGAHVRDHANLWRISDDFWDRWEPLHGMFGRLDKWTPFRAEGAWPDADMLPFGIIEFNRPTRFTREEQRLCMSLWAMARAPLIFGGDLTRLDPFTRSLLTNPEVLAVNQHSRGNRQLSRYNNLIVWTAEVPGSDDRYVGLFNAQGSEFPYDASHPAFKSAVLRGTEPSPVSVRANIKGAKRLVLVLDGAGDNSGYDHGAWLEPKLVGPAGEVALERLPWTRATSGWGTVRVNRSVDDKPLERGGKAVNGLGAHALSAIEYALPEGYETFTATGIMTAGGYGRGTIAFVVLVDPETEEAAPTQAVSVALSDLGFSGKVQVRDLWARENLGEVEGTFTCQIPQHGAGLYRLGVGK